MSRNSLTHDNAPGYTRRQQLGAVYRRIGWDREDIPKGPARLMLLARVHGTSYWWTELVKGHARCWSPRQRKRFSMWCAMHMLPPDTQDYTMGHLQTAIAACWEEDSQ
jgi:hypothetical protein